MDFVDVRNYSALVSGKRRSPSMWGQRQSNAAAGECILVHPAPYASSTQPSVWTANVTNDSAVTDRYTRADAQETHNA